MVVCVIVWRVWRVWSVCECECVIVWRVWSVWCVTVDVVQEGIPGYLHMF